MKATYRQGGKQPGEYFTGVAHIHNHFYQAGQDLVTIENQARRYPKWTTMHSIKLINIPENHLHLS